jgi:hypothetical protein
MTAGSAFAMRYRPLVSKMSHDSVGSTVSLESFVIDEEEQAEGTLPVHGMLITCASCFCFLPWKRSSTNLNLLFVLLLPLLVITCIALVNSGTIDDTVVDSHSLCKDYDHLLAANKETQDLWNEMRDRFRLLSSDVPQMQRPTMPWTHRCAIIRYRASRTVALLLEAAAVQRQRARLLKESAAVADGLVDVRPENETKLQQLLGPCGLEFMELMNVCPSNDTADSEANATQSTAIYTLVYAAKHLNRIPKKARADPRYRVLDQSRNAALLDTTKDGIAQFPQLFPLRHPFQAQISEWGALLAIADSLTRGTPLRQTVGSRQGTTASSHSTNMPTWIGVNPIKRFLPPKTLDRLQLNPTQDRNTVFFWTTCCGGDDVSSQFIDFHQYDSGPDLNELHLDIGHSVFGPSYTTQLPVRTWSYKGTFLMHHTLFLEFACFCQVFLAHLLDRHVTVLRRSSVGNNDSSIDIDLEAVRPELFMKIWIEPGHTNTVERTWGYLFERLINYWAYNSGYGMILIDDTSKEFRKEIKRNHGRLRVLEPVAESNLTETQKRLRSCRSMFCSTLADPTLSSSLVQRQAQCPHLYDGRESML